MKMGWVGLLAYMAVLAAYFVSAKVHNDSQIALDTSRIADAVERIAYKTDGASKGREMSPLEVAQFEKQLENRNEVWSHDQER